MEISEERWLPRGMLEFYVWRFAREPRRVIIEKSATFLGRGYFRPRINKTCDEIPGKDRRNFGEKERERTLRVRKIQGHRESSVFVQFFCTFSKQRHL